MTHNAPILLQFPPFWQGVEEQGLICILQFGPVNPNGHKQVYDNKLLWEQVPPFKQGKDIQ
jgi:hypothetical protein